MTLKSALEDLTQTTLKAISGTLGKLDYVSRLRSRTGSYTHWGLARLHGEDQAQQALTKTHRTLLSRVLRTPLQRLAEDVEISSRAASMEPAKYLESLQNRSSDLLPANPGAGSERHLSSVLTALLGLIKNRRGATPPTS
jgi:hypothetical protein